MGDATNSWFISFIVCSLLIVFGIITERWLVRNGFTRDNTILIVFGTITISLIKYFKFPHVSWLYFVPLMILGIVFGANRGDLWTTMNKGRWWWK